MQADDDESSDELVGLRRTRRSYLSGSGTVPRGIWRAGEEDDDDDDDELACLLASPDDGKVDIEDCNAAEGSLKPAIRCSPAPQSGKKRVRIDEAQNTCNVPQRKRQSQEPPAVALADDDMAFLDDLLGDADSAATLSLPGSSDPPTPATPTPPDSRAPPAPVAPAPTLHTAAHLDCMLDAQLSSDEEDQDTAPPPQIATTATAAAAPPAADAKKAKGSSASALLQKLREKKGGSSGANSSSSPDAEGSSSDGEGPDDADGAGFDLFSMQKGTGVGGGGAEAGIQHPAPAAPAADDDDFYAEAEAAEREEEDARLHNKGGPSGGSPAPLDFMQGGVFSFEALNAQSERQAAAAQPSGGDLWASLCRGAGDHQQAEGAPHPTPQQQPPQPPRQPQGAASSEPNPLKDEGNKHLQAGRFQEAVRCYGEALEAGAPDTHVLYSNRSCAHLSLGQHKRAFQDAVACVLERPAWFKGRLRKAMALRAVGQAIEAAAELRVAAECCDAAQDVASKDSVLAQAKKEVTPPADPSTGRFYEAFVKEATLGTRAYQDKDWSGSVRHYSKALSIDRSSVTVLSNRSAAFAHLNQFQQALTDASQCVVLNPRHPKGYIRKAAALKGLSLFTESTEALRSGVRAVEASGGDAAALKQQLAQQGSGRGQPLHRAHTQPPRRCARRTLKSRRGKEAKPPSAVLCAPAVGTTDTPSSEGLVGADREERILPQHQAGVQGEEGSASEEALCRSTMRGPSLQVVTSGPLPDSQMLRPDEPERNRFPCCIVWAPLPLITWLFPIVGHMGIADSRGVVHDFAGPYTINKDSFMVGKVRRVCRVGEAGRVTEWDQAIEEADQEYRDKMHNICCQNCHHHTAAALTRYGIPSTQFSALWMLLTQGRWVSPSAAVATFLPFVIIVTVIAVVAALSKTSQ